MCRKNLFAIMTLGLLVIPMCTSTIAASMHEEPALEFGSIRCPDTARLTPSEARKVLLSTHCAVSDTPEPIPGSNPPRKPASDQTESSSGSAFGQLLTSKFSKLLAWMLR